eukprot:2872147-Alexandrium_andersonii.AAC.1
MVGANGRRRVVLSWAEGPPRDGASQGALRPDARGGLVLGGPELCLRGLLHRRQDRSVPAAPLLRREA